MVKIMHWDGAVMDGAVTVNFFTFFNEILRHEEVVKQMPANQKAFASISIFLFLNIITGFSHVVID